MQPRFDPDGDCLIVAVDFVLRKLGFLLPESDLLKINSKRAVILLFEKLNLKYNLIIPLLTILNPINIFFLYNIFSKVALDKKLKKIQGDFLKSKKSFFIIYHVTAQQVYGIKNEFWTHYIVAYFDGVEFFIYDPLKKTLETESIGRVKNITKNQLDSYKGIKILVYN